MENGAHMGRGELPVGEADVAALEDVGRQVAEAIARGDFDHARMLTGDAIRQHAAGESARDASGKNTALKRTEKLLERIVREKWPIR
jgi:hypothetical protein